PHNWRAVEVEARVRSTGGLEDARLLGTSGNDRFDQAALAAVKRELALHPFVPTEGLRVARFRIAAGRAVVPPNLGGTIAPGSRGLRGLDASVRFRFDETTAKVNMEKPFTDD